MLFFPTAEKGNFIMDFFENEYAVPVLCGGGVQAAKVLSRIIRTPAQKPHIFSDRFSIRQRLFAVCHRVSLCHPGIVCSAICDFAENIDESNTPLFILYDGETAGFSMRYKEKLEGLFIIVDLTDVFNK